MVRDKHQRVQKMFNCGFDKDPKSYSIQWLWNRPHQPSDFCCGNSVTGISTYK
jgi:hypothetical protein